jgi:hypothetical protein
VEQFHSMQYESVSYNLHIHCQVLPGKTQTGCVFFTRSICVGVGENSLRPFNLISNPIVAPCHEKILYICYTYTIPFNSPVKFEEYKKSLSFSINCMAKA